MTVGEGRRYCGEHMVVAGEAEVRNLFFIFETLFWFYVQLQYKLVAVCLKPHLHGRKFLARLG